MIALGNGFLDMVPKVQVTKINKQTANKLHFTSPKLSASKDTITKVKRQCTEWEKLFANCVSDEGLICRAFTAQK
jgi:hypothetical protein